MEIIFCALTVIDLIVGQLKHLFIDKKTNKVHD